MRAGSLLRSLDLPADMIGTSYEWAVSKPDLRFFARVAEEAPCAAGQVLYVGDRVDNDIRPALAAGMRAALIRRGPWAIIQYDRADAADLPPLRIDSLSELPTKIAELGTAGG